MAERWAEPAKIINSRGDPLERIYLGVRPRRVLAEKLVCGVEMWRGGLGAAYLFPALSSAGASLAAPCFRFHIPLIEPDRPVSGIRLSEKVSRGRPRETARPLSKADKA